MSNSKPANTAHALAKVRALAAENNVGGAIEYIKSIGMSNVQLRNAFGVCLIRAGELDKATDTFRALCVGEGVVLKSDADPLHLTNYATALLLKGNVSGCLNILQHLRDSEHAATARLRDAVERWRASLSWWQRFNVNLGTYEPGEQIELGYCAGEFE